MKLLILLLLLAGGVAHAQSWTPVDQQIARLEGAIKLSQLPEWNSHLPPLSGYARYYAGTTLNGEKVIIGELVNRWYKPGIYFVTSSDAFPKVLDGGCGVVNLVYSIRQEKFLSIRCNGRA